MIEVSGGIEYWYVVSDSYYPKAPHAPLVHTPMYRWKIWGPFDSEDKAFDFANVGHRVFSSLSPNKEEALEEFKKGAIEKWRKREGPNPYRYSYSG